jgi:hypothetical protein
MSSPQSTSTASSVTTTSTHDSAGNAVAAVSGNGSSSEVVSDVRILTSFEDDVHIPEIIFINHHEVHSLNETNKLRSGSRHEVYAIEINLVYKVVKKDTLELILKGRLRAKEIYLMNRFDGRIAEILGNFGYGPAILEISDDKMLMKQTRCYDVGRLSTTDGARFNEIFWSIASMGLLWVDCKYQNFMRDHTRKIVIVDFESRDVVFIKSANPYALYYHMWKMFKRYMPYILNEYYDSVINRFVLKDIEMHGAASIREDSRFYNIYRLYRKWCPGEAIMHDVQTISDDIIMPELNTEFTTAFKTQILKIT